MDRKPIWNSTKKWLALRCLSLFPSSSFFILYWCGRFLPLSVVRGRADMARGLASPGHWHRVTHPFPVAPRVALCLSLSPGNAGRPQWRGANVISGVCAPAVSRREQEHPLSTLLRRLATRQPDFCFFLQSRCDRKHASRWTDDPPSIFLLPSPPHVLFLFHLQFYRLEPAIFQGLPIKKPKRSSRLVRSGKPIP